MVCDRSLHGANALQLLQTYEPALALLDIGMPEMDGYDLCRRIRALRGTSTMIVAITGWGQEEDRRRAHEAGFDLHLTKPVDADALESLVRAASEQASSKTIASFGDASLAAVWSRLLFVPERDRTSWLKTLREFRENAASEVPTLSMSESRVAPESVNSSTA